MCIRDSILTSSVLLRTRYRQANRAGDTTGGVASELRKRSGLIETSRARRERSFVTTLTAWDQSLRYRRGRGKSPRGDLPRPRRYLKDWSHAVNVVTNDRSRRAREVSMSPDRFRSSEATPPVVSPARLAWRYRVRRSTDEVKMLSLIHI